MLHPIWARPKHDPPGEQLSMYASPPAQAIEEAIERGLQRVEAGAQGEVHRC